MSDLWSDDYHWSAPFDCGHLFAVGLIVLLVLLAFSPIALWASGVFDTPPYVVRVDVDYTHHQDRGSGVLIAHDKVLTCFHNIRDGGSVSINGQPARVLKTDKLNDLALLEVAPVFADPISLGSPVQVGDRITVHGYAMGHSYESVTARVVGYRAPSAIAEDTILVLDKPAKPGMSGGPYLNERGELVGIHFGSRGGSHGSGIEAIREFLK